MGKKLFGISFWVLFRALRSVGSNFIQCLGMVIQNIFTCLYEFTLGSLPEHFCGKGQAESALLSNAQQEINFFEVLNFTTEKLIKTYITDC